MSDQDKPDSDDNTADDGMPDGIPAPPMPKPDLFDIIEEGPTYRTDQEETKGRRKKKKKKKSQHPLDNMAKPGENPKQAKGCCGCIGGGLLFLLLLTILLVVVVAWFGPGRYVAQGYEVVSLEEPESTITTPPDGPTFYLGQKIEYTAPLTTVPIAFAAQEVTFSGDFHEDVAVTAVKVTGLDAARLAKNLEVYAVEFSDEGITLNGELGGRVMQNAE